MSEPHRTAPAASPKPHVIAPLADAVVEELEASGALPRRMSRENVRGLCMVVTGEARSLREAAAFPGLTEGALHSFAKRESAKKIRGQAKTLFLQSGPSKALKKLILLSQTAESEAVAMRASERIRDEAGFRPKDRAEVLHTGPAQAPVIIAPVIHPNALAPGQLEAIFPQLAQQPPERDDDACMTLPSSGADPNARRAAYRARGPSPHQSAAQRHALAATRSAMRSVCERGCRGPRRAPLPSIRLRTSASSSTVLPARRFVLEPRRHSQTPRGGCQSMRRPPGRLNAIVRRAPLDVSTISQPSARRPGRMAPASR